MLVAVSVSVAVGAPIVVAVGVLVVDGVAVGVAVSVAVGGVVTVGVAVAGGATNRKRGLTTALRPSVTETPLFSMRVSS